MSDLKNKFTFDGKLYERNADGTLEKVITTDNIESSGIVEVTPSNNGESINVNTVGLTINSNGLLCATFYEEEV